MNIKEIKALADILICKNLTALEVTEGETKIRLEKQPAAAYASPVQPYTPTAAAVSAETCSNVETAPAKKSCIEIKSPMVGVFYAAPSPGATPFVQVGSKIKKGDVLCIIEAMKLMNELTAEVEGEIAEICVSNGDVVEFGQPLFRLV